MLHCEPPTLLGVRSAYFGPADRETRFLWLAMTGSSSVFGPCRVKPFKVARHAFVRSIKRNINSGTFYNEGD